MEWTAAKPDEQLHLIIRVKYVNWSKTNVVTQSKEEHLAQKILKLLTIKRYRQVMEWTAAKPDEQLHLIIRVKYVIGARVGKQTKP